MTIRLFDWRDFLALYRYRNQGAFFDSSLVLTRGPNLVPAGALFSYFAPATGIYTYLCSDNGTPGQPLIGQLRHMSSSSFARLSYLAPEAELDSDALQTLLEHMFVQVGDRGAIYFLAEVNEESVVFESLRQAGFAIYARQRIWQLDGEPAGEVVDTAWRRSTNRDILGIRTLYNDLVPGLVQQVEPPPTEESPGIVYRQGDEVLAYIETKFGPRGIWIQPFIHPDVKEVSGRLVDFIQSIQNRHARPIYVSVRSYQSWLEGAMKDLAAQPGPHQAVMVKHLAIAKKVLRPFALGTLEGRQPEVTTPFARSESKR
jgi:hypothetical protein